MRDEVGEYDVFIEDGQIRIIFGDGDVTWEVYMDPADAKDFAALLAEVADLAHQNGV